MTDTYTHGGGMPVWGYGQADRWAMQLEAPYVSQRNSHWNAEMNCVPASLAMTVMHFRPDIAGRFPSTGKLVAAISETMLSMQGSTGVDGLRDYRVLGALGQRLGLRLQRRGGIDVNELARACLAGRHAIVIGDAYALSYARHLNRAQVDDAGHAILVHGFDRARGLFQVNDPAEPGMRERWVSPQELWGFVGALSRDLDGAPFGSTTYVSAA
jgi:hypothetical protein